MPRATPATLNNGASAAVVSSGVRKELPTLTDTSRAKDLDTVGSVTIARRALHTTARDLTASAKPTTTHTAEMFASTTRTSGAPFDYLLSAPARRALHEFSPP